MLYNSMGVGIGTGATDRNLSDNISAILVTAVLAVVEIGSCCTVVGKVYSSSVSS